MPSAQPEPIAIIGSGCRFPGNSTSPSKFWKLLENPRDLSRDIPEDRFEHQAYYNKTASHHGTTNVQRAYTLEEDVRLFDATFFNISPNEADAIDPQHRLFMEAVYEALEAGGQTIENLRGSDTSVYVGTMSADYGDIIHRDLQNTPTYAPTGVSRAVLSNRLSYFFDWHGPSMTIDTACSSSIVALHQAVQSLRSKESRVAICGGTDLLLGPEMFITFSKMTLLSPTGQSRMWDADANGYARGDGIATVVLKKLSDAIADGDHIECIIRETGVNQDGKSNGITVPSSEAQAELVRATYARGGLDLADPKDWPQFFEAHGTGTKVGDPKEAATIADCFGAGGVNGNPLYVGSVKTIVGHTEGTAGLAGVLKASLAVQHGIIPPNMLFNRLNPDIEQYYKNLEIPTTATKWPTLPEGVPRRVSVNSFGFGGTNGHAIIESYEPAKSTAAVEPASNGTCFTPLTFSAVSDESLSANLKSFSEFLKTPEGAAIDLTDLAFTLQERRSALQSKTTISATSVDTLVAKIDKKLSETKPGTSIGQRSTPGKPRILGVFTGQGAQWATMGKQLIKCSAFVREKLSELDESLATLPEADRPAWTIAEQLSAAKDVSRLGEAALSQPVCTAIQVVLVDMLKVAGVEFEAVVGHSSGEIAAAYAAGYINAHDAIRIAFYRGVHAKHSAGAQGQKGGMLAVGTSWEDAEEMLNKPEFKGRVKIAAKNSDASLTLSGDIDGIEDVKKAFDEQKKFARALQVDTAYHSHHMLPCGGPYVASLQACGIKINKNRASKTQWFSSVKPGDLITDNDALADYYWRDNMCNAVLFADAVKAAASEELTLAIETGPHPALRGPALQNISAVRSNLPYTGVLARNTNDVEAFADALGTIWTLFGPGAIDFRAYEKLVSPEAAPKLAIGLPSYQWAHGRVHWHETRRMKNLRVRGSAFHELLGIPSPDNTELDLRWGNYLNVNEISWLSGHQLQGQTVFPAAGYVAMALEAAKKLAGDKTVKLYEVHDLTIDRAISFDENPSFQVETVAALTGITPLRPGAKVQKAEFSLYMCPTGGNGLELSSKASVTIIYGTPDFSTLSSTPLDQSHLTEIDSEHFYGNLELLGYGYNNSFRTLTNTKRRFGEATANVATYEYDDDEETMVAHPAMLDTSFQAALLALSSPGDESLWSMHVPTSIKCVRVNPELCASLPTSSVELPLSAVLHESESLNIHSSLDIFSEDGEQTLVQIEDLVMKTFSPATAADDRFMFSNTQFNVASPNAAITVGKELPSSEEVEIAGLAERLAYFYLRKWNTEVTQEQWEKSGKHYQALRDSIKSVISTVESGRHPSVKKEWASDDVSTVYSLIAKYPESVDLNIISALGENVYGALSSGDSSVLDQALQSGLLNDLYSKGLGFAQYNAYLGRLVQQITHRYPHTKILEVGARNGATTKAILGSLGNAYSSYTFTDATDASFKTVQDLFKGESKVHYKVFDASKEPASQEIEEGSYDIVVASTTLHGFPSLQAALENTRRLLKPGGYLFLSEITSSAPVRILALLGSLPGFWTGLEDGRKSGAIAKPSVWHNALRKSGFSGVDNMTPEVDGIAWPLSIMVSQAVDERIDFLRKPLAAPSFAQMDDLVILGNKSLETSRLAEEISEITSKFCHNVTILEGLPTIDDEIMPMTTFINLVDLDEPIFKDINEEKMEGLKSLFELAKNVLWVTKGARVGEPYHRASLGFGRSIAYEMPDMTLQFLDLGAGEIHVPRLITESVLRLAAAEELEGEKMLWSEEPEYYMENGQLMVPRLISNEDQNSRINALRRPVTKTVDPRSTVVSVSQEAGRLLVLREEPVTEDANSNVKTGESDPVKISHSILTALNVAPETFLHLSVGVSESGKVVCLSDTNATRVFAAASVSVDVPAASASGFLAATAAEILAASLIARIPVKGSILVHEPGQDEYLASALTRQATAKAISVAFSTTNGNAKNSSWIKFNSWTPAHIVKRTLPVKLTHFLDLAADEEDNIASLSIRQGLPSTCRQINTSDLFSFQAVPPPSEDAFIMKTLETAISSAKSAASDVSPSDIVRASQLSDDSILKHPTSVIDWTADAYLDVQVQAIDASRLFSQTQTYLLIGLGEQVGKSLTEWLAKNGAGHIALINGHASVVDSKWRAAIEQNGISISSYTAELTSKTSVEAVVDEIKSSLPPIGGVAGGASITQDTPFQEMPLEMMEAVTKSKIEGTNIIDEIFADNSLDFFIVLSSPSAVLGQSGQSAETAANAYLTALVSQRRARGLAGTYLGMTKIGGIEGEVSKDDLATFGLMATSEADLHHLFSEAIRAGAPTSNSSPIIVTGGQTVHDDDESHPVWYENPRLSHKILEASGGESKADGKKNLPVKEQFAEATTIGEASTILKDAFALKLARMSNLEEGSVGYDVPLPELGIDSLVAVEVRGWFLKEVKTDMPVLKVLGGGTVAELCDQAMEKVPPTMLPSLGAEKGGKSQKEGVKSAPKPSKETKRTANSSSSDGSSGTRSPVDTPATTLSQAGSSTDLAGALKKAAQGDKKEADSSSPYVKSELVSFPQSRFWFLQFLVEDQSTFNVCFHYKITGNLRIGDLERAVRLVSMRHESLRTAFVAHEVEADLAYQKVLPKSTMRLERKKIESVDEVDIEFQKMRAIPHDLASGKLFRLILLTLSPSEHYLLFNYHHILMDGISLQNFMADLEKAYQRQSLGTPPRQLPDFARAQRAAFENGDMNGEIQYWRDQFPEGHPVLPLLPMAKVNARIPLHSFATHQVQYRIKPDLMAKIREKSKAARSTTFHFYMAVFKAMLFRCTDAKDLTIGIADGNRNDSDTMGTVGLMLNLLTLRFKFEGDEVFNDSVANAREKTYEALGNSRVPFDVLLTELNVPRSSSYSPFFQAFFDYRQGHKEEQAFGNTHWEFASPDFGRTAYDMTLDITDNADGALVLFRAQTALYSKTATQLLLNTYVHLLETFANDTSLALKDPPLSSDSELKRSLEVARGWDLETTWPETIPLRVDQMIEEHKDKIALKDGHDAVLTYAQMGDRINAIAEALQKVGVGKGSRCLVFEDATADWPCSLLAIMRLGGVYVPLDLRNPLARLADVAKTCEPTAILVDKTTVGDVPEVNVTNAQVLNVSEVSATPNGFVENVSKGADVAAILFSSGSTGKPKGIVVKGSGLRNEIEGYTTQWELKDEVALQQSAFTFNHSSDQMYTGLTNGGSVYIVPWDKRGDPIEVSKIIANEGITYTKATPAEYGLWLDYGRENLERAKDWRKAFGGGEVLTETFIKELAKLDLPNLRFFNSYGPTEISISSTKMEIPYREATLPYDGRIPCGFALPNYVKYILNEKKEPVPVGMPGELWIGGAGVSLGYLGNKELTEHHYHPDPFATERYIKNGWTTMYRTGDIAHLQDDGTMIFHNRVAGDSQVKIRGLRIELGDIESNIIKDSKGLLRDACVTLRDEATGMLVCHVVFAPNHGIKDTDAYLKNLLSKLQLPQYMIPVMAIPLDRMPLSKHSKVDRKVLKEMPLPDRAEDESKEDDGELTPTMNKLKEVWQGVLNTKEFGLSITPSTSFFTIGGNSLLIVRLQARIRNAFNVTIRLVDLLGASSLGEMAKAIDESAGVELIDWKKEIKLPDLSSIGAVDKSAPIKTSGKVILFTGSGGFLGKHVLKHLIDSSDVSKIHCIGLREKPPGCGEPRELAVSSDKIVIHRADLTDAWLGLGESEYWKLAGEVDSIMHMAAIRPFHDSYHILRPNNVVPTQEIIKFAAARQIPIHYTSTAGVIPGEVAGSTPGSVVGNPPSTDGQNGYISTRWTCEQILEKAATELNVPTIIHRFVPATEKPRELVQPALEHFITFVDRSEIFPDFTDTEGHWDMAPADRASGVLAKALVGTPEQASNAQYFHHDCEVRITVKEFMEHMERERGGKERETLPGLRFMGMMKRMGLEYFISSHLFLQTNRETGEVIESKR